MTGPLKEILVVGFGAIGAVYSLVFKQSGLARVTVVARSNYEVINDHGMHFKSRRYGDIPGWKPDRRKLFVLPGYSCTHRWLVFPSVASAADRKYDYVVVTTKAIPELTTTPKILAPLLENGYTSKFSQPTYVILQNGLNVEVDLYHAIKKLGIEPSIVGSSIYIGTNLLAPDVIQHAEGDRPTLGMFRYRDYTTTVNTPAEEAILQDIGGIFKAGGSEVTTVTEIQRKKFSKNFWNIAFSSLATLTHYRLPAIFRAPPSDPSTTPYEPYVYPLTANKIEEHTIPTVRAMLEELIVLGRAMGFPDTEDSLPAVHAQRTIENTRKLHVKPDSEHTPSMALDAWNGYPIEVEVIVGEVVRLAKEYKVDIPRVEMLYALLLVVQNQILRKRAYA